MTVEMHVKNKSYNGFYGGVKFNRGVGIFDDEAMAKDLATRYGYEIKPHDNNTKVSTNISTNTNTNTDTKVSTIVDTKETVEVSKPKRKPRKTKVEVGE